MGQKVNPISLRIDLNRSQDSLWYADSLQYKKIITQELQMRQYQEKSLRSSNYFKSREYFEMRPKSKVLTSFFLIPDVQSPFFSNIKDDLLKPSSKANTLIHSNLSFKIDNRKDFLKQAVLSKLNTLEKNIDRKTLTFMIKSYVNDQEIPAFTTQFQKTEKFRFVRLPASELFCSAHFIAHELVTKLESRQSWRECIKSIERILVKIKEKSKIRGIKIQCSGRIGGVEIAQKDSISYGQTSLQSFAARVDYAQQDAHTPSGILGIQVWLCYD